MTEHKIRDFEGWEVLYDDESQKFFARRGRKHIRLDGYQSQQSHVEAAIHVSNVNEDRAKKRKNAKPLTFRRWIKDKALEQTVTMVSYTAQGLRLEIDGEKKRERNNYSSHTLLVIPDNIDAMPLHQAEEACRRAKEQMRKALADCTVEVELKEQRGREAAEDYIAEEDRARARIEELNS